MTGPLWVSGWATQALLLLCAAVLLWNNIPEQATSFIVGAAVIAVIRQIERDRRDRDDPPPGSKV